MSSFTKAQMAEALAATRTVDPARRDAWFRSLRYESVSWLREAVVGRSATITKMGLEVDPTATRRLVTMAVVINEEAGE